MGIELMAELVRFGGKFGKDRSKERLRVMTTERRIWVELLLDMLGGKT